MEMLLGDYIIQIGMYDVIMMSSNLDFDENVFLVFNAARMGQWQLHADWFF